MREALVANKPSLSENLPRFDGGLFLDFSTAFESRRVLPQNVKIKSTLSDYCVGKV